MRLIDAHALAAHFMCLPPDYYHTSYIVGEIMAAPTVGGWISVEDRMPTAYEDVLCYAVKGWSWHRFIGWLNGDEWVLDGVEDEVPERKATHFGWEVTHWMPLPKPLMPLPKPPKEVSGDD